MTGFMAAGDAPRKVRLGVVGGGFGAEFLWHEHPDCVVGAVSDLMEERRDRLAKVYKCPTAYESLEELLKDRTIEAVALFTGAPMHAKHALQALRAGKHVMTDAPACWSLEEADQLAETVRKSGLTYMMAETSYYLPFVISARRMALGGRFGEMIACDADYILPEWDADQIERARTSWRYGAPPTRWASHGLALFTGVADQRLVEVVCHGTGLDLEVYKENAHENAFSRETALFKTSTGGVVRARLWTRGGREGAAANYYGSKMSFLESGRLILRTSGQTEKDAGGFERALPTRERPEVAEWHKTELLPEPLRHATPYGNTLGFITHEFVDALSRGRRPAIDIEQALACTVAGIVAHASAAAGGRLMKIPQYAAMPKA